MSLNVGNVLGNPRAEADRLLTKAFVETSDFRALVETDDFHIVVGRRGTGKSALFERVKGYFEGPTRVCIHAETPREHFALAVQDFLERANHNYRTARAVCRILWRSYILTVVACIIKKSSKIEDRNLARQMREYFRVHPDLWYPVPPMKGGHSYGEFTVYRHPDPPDRGPRFDQSHPR